MFKKLCFLLLAAVVLLSFSACSTEKEKGPREVFQEYLDAWQANSFASMYGMLSDDSRKMIGENDFVQKYTNIYNGIEAKNLQIQAEFPAKMKPDPDGILAVDYTGTVDTVAGTISFANEARLRQETVNEKKEWKLVWDTEMIFPNMESGDKIRVETLKARRGEIIDRNENPLAMNGTAMDVGIVPGKLKADQPDSKKNIAAILGVTVENIDKKLSASYVKPDMFIPIKTISEDEKEKKEQLLKIPGVMINSKKTRVYPLGEKAAHITGYIQSLNAEEIEKLKADGYTQEDVIGKTGLERIYEKTLRAKPGVEIYILDKDGKKKLTLVKKEPEDGRDVKLTIDSNLQSALYDQLSADAASGVAVNPMTGEVLALVSTPAYNPNSFVLGMSESEWKGLNENPKKPLLNKFTSNFVPGSLFKPVTAAIGLKTGRLDMSTVKDIKGLKWQKGKGWGNYFVTRVSEYPGPANFLNAMIHSDNIYFAQTALDVGLEAFQTEVGNFGLGEKLPFEMELARSQFDGDGVVKSEVQLADSGYGQGEVLVNPIHMASIYTSFVNGGNIIEPYLEYKHGTEPVKWKSDVFSADIAGILLNTLAQVVENPVGTGHQAYMKDLPLAGKTGTAEIKQKQGDVDGTELGWFAAVNVNDPKLLVLAMVEDVKDRGGSHYVVPKVKAVFEQYFKH